MSKKTSLGTRRVFSPPLKRQVVSDIESGKVSVAGVAREYGVSQTAVYKWLNKYSRTLQSTQKIVVEMQSESYKTRELEKQLKELQAALGRKQLEVDFLNRLLEKGKEQLGIDLKKNFCTPPSTGSGSTKSNTDTP